MGADRTRAALSQMAGEDPELAARLVLMTLPAMAARIKASLTYDLELDGLGSWRVSTANGGARMEPAEGLDGGADFKLATDARGLADLAGGAGPLRLLLGRRMRLEGKRRKALALREMGGDPPSMSEVAQAGVFLHPGVMFPGPPHPGGPHWAPGPPLLVPHQLASDGGGGLGVGGPGGRAP